MDSSNHTEHYKKIVLSLSLSLSHTHTHTHTLTHTKHDCTSAQCVVKYISYWLHVKDGQLPPTRTTVKVNQKLLSQCLYM